jgi:hypothetical protein
VGVMIFPNIVHGDGTLPFIGLPIWGNPLRWDGQAYIAKRDIKAGEDLWFQLPGEVVICRREDV